MNPERSSARIFAGAASCEVHPEPVREHPLMPRGALPAEENGTPLRSASAVFSACVKDR